LDYYFIKFQVFWKRITRRHLRRTDSKETRWW